jgi:hypothetical protein
MQWQADEVGNIFVVTVSVDMADIPGRHVRSKPDEIVNYLPHSATIHALTLAELRRLLKAGRRSLRTAPNPGHCTWELVVPRQEFGQCSPVLQMADLFALAGPLRRWGSLHPPACKSPFYAFCRP